MSSRLHNKWHRHNHHTNTLNEPQYPDASHDPIASYESPFQGDFVLNGMLSASNGALFAQPLSGTVVFIGNNVTKTYNTPLTAQGDFLIINVNGVDKGIRLWQLP